jgi:hypothetical protein
MLAPSVAMPPEPDKGQLATFIRVMLKHATPGTIVSIRAFGGDSGKAKIKRSFEIEADDDLKSVIVGATFAAREAAKNGWVFSPPVATFKNERNAKESNLAQGFCITVELDERPQAGLETLTALIGKPTLVVESGGRWTNPDTSEVEPKLHLYWALKTPAHDEASLTKLKHARAFATAIVGADPSCVPICHPLRWCGSWHLKDPANPRLCRIVGDIGNEVDLDAVYDILQKAAPAEVVIKAKNTKHHVAKDPAKPRNVFQDYLAISMAETSRVTTTELAEMVKAIPNADRHWHDWNSFGLAIFDVTNGSADGLRLFDQLSRKSKKYDEQETAARWQAYRTSPPDRTGIGKLRAEAERRGWKTPPTHAVSEYTTIEAARSALKRIVGGYFKPPNEYAWYALTQCASVSAICIDPGLGKTTITIEQIRDHLLDEIADSELKLIHYAVSTRALAIEVAGKLRDRGVNARPFFGRSAPDPENPGETMCLQLDVVELAIQANIPVARSCCKRGDDVCPLYDECGFQRQARDTGDVQVWVFASDYIFHQQDTLGTADRLIIDESFWQKQLDGVEGKPVPLSLSFRSPELQAIGEALMKQFQDGGVRLSHVRYAGSAESLSALINEHWREIGEIQKQVDMRPGMSAEDVKAHLEQHGISLKRMAYLHVVRKMLEELRDQIMFHIPVSGRLSLVTVEEKDGTEWRGVTRCGVKEITKQFQVPTMMLDATMPALEILRVSHPHVKVKAKLHVKFPDAVRIRQVRNTPTAANKLLEGDAAPKHQQEVRRYILQRFIETGRQKTLVIAQQDYEEWLKGKLPKEIAVAHYNAIAGLDEYRNVRLLILVGRSQPVPEGIEKMAGALSGRMPAIVGEEAHEKEFVWFPRVKRGIRLKDGSGIAVMGDRHPDKFCEMIRYQITESELLQAIGRGRAVNRDDSSPLDIDLLFDTVLPIEVDEAPLWETPSPFISTAIDGVMLMSPKDLATTWPDVWANTRAADRSLKDFPELPGFEKFFYRPIGAKMKRRHARFDRALIPDPTRWLIDRFGPVEVTAP